MLFTSLRIISTQFKLYGPEILEYSYRKTNELGFNIAIDRLGDELFNKSNFYQIVCITNILVSSNQKKILYQLIKNTNILMN